MDDIRKITERCVLCTDTKRLIDMKFFQRSGHFVCKPCLESITDGFMIAQVRMGYKWSK